MRGICHHPKLLNERTLLTLTQVLTRRASDRTILSGKDVDACTYTISENSVLPQYYAFRRPGHTPRPPPHDFLPLPLHNFHSRGYVHRYVPFSVRPHFLCCSMTAASVSHFSRGIAETHKCDDFHPWGCSSGLPVVASAALSDGPRKLAASWL